MFTTINCQQNLFVFIFLSMMWRCWVIASNSISDEHQIVTYYCSQLIHQISYNDKTYFSPKTYLVKTHFIHAQWARFLPSTLTLIKPNVRRPMNILSTTIYTTPTRRSDLTNNLWKKWPRQMWSLPEQFIQVNSTHSHSPFFPLLESHCLSVILLPRRRLHDLHANITNPVAARKFICDLQRLSVLLREHSVSQFASTNFACVRASSVLIFVESEISAESVNAKYITAEANAANEN